jgi:hypothetical protein
LGIDWDFVYGSRGNVYSFCFNRFTSDLKENLIALSKAKAIASLAI